MIWHSESTAAVLSQLQTDRVDGLTSDEAAARFRTLRSEGRTGGNQRPFLACYAHRLKRPAILLGLLVSLILLGVALYQNSAGHPNDWWVTTLVPVLLILRPLPGAVWEAWSARTLSRLDRQAAPPARVWRDGERQTVSSTELVPGDIIDVTEGDLIPADCRLLESFELHCDESPLTDDPLSAQKMAEVSVPAIAPLDKRVNMLYEGCVVSHGRGVGVVVETGTGTELQKAARLRSAKKEAALPLKGGLDRLSHSLFWPTLIAAIATVLLALFRHTGIFPALMAGLALFAALLPEEIPAISSLATIPGVKRLIRQGTSLHRLSAAEELGRTAVICTDKTGTLTRNDMTLVRAFVKDHMVKLDDNRMPADLSTLIQLAVLCTGHTRNATDAAITEYAEKHDMDRAELTAAFPRLGDIPFTPERRRMTAVHLVEGRNFVIVKGAPDDLLPLCNEVPPELADAMEFMGAEGLRMLAVAYKTVPDVPTHCYPEELENDLTFLGLLGLTDPPQEDTIKALQECQAAGIRPVMLTGDSLITATAVARRVGLYTDPSQAVTGEEIASMSDEELASRLTEWTVFARLSAEDKQRVVAAWQTRRTPVLVTGDHVADVPALRTADIGCAMRRIGADVAASSADVVLTNDRFSFLIRAIRIGRTLFDNLRKAAGYRLAALISILPVPALSLLILGKKALLSPAALLWLGLMGVVSIFALGREPAGRDTMRRPPRAERAGLLSPRMAGMLFCGVTLAVAALIAPRFAGGDTAVLFAVLALGQTVLLLIARSSMPLLASSLHRAPWTLLALLLLIAGAAAPLFLAPVADWFGLPLLSEAGRRVTLIVAGALWALSELVKIVALFFPGRKTQ